MTNSRVSGESTLCRQISAGCLQRQNSNSELRTDHESQTILTPVVVNIRNAETQAQSMPSRLKALYADVLLDVSGEDLILGRSRQLQISATTVSRHACTVTKTDSCVNLTAVKTVYVMRCGSHAVEAVPKGYTYQVPNCADSNSNQLPLKLAERL